MILHARMQAVGKEGTLCEPERHPLAPSSLHAFFPATPSLIPHFVPPALPHSGDTLARREGGPKKRDGYGNEVWRTRGASPPPHYPVGSAGGRGRSRWLMADYRLLESGTPELKNIYNPGILHPTLGLRMPGVVRTPFASKVLLPGGSLSLGT